MTRKWETCHEVQSAVNMIPINYCKLESKVPWAKSSIIRCSPQSQQKYLYNLLFKRLHNPGCSVIVVQWGKRTQDWYNSFLQTSCITEWPAFSEKKKKLSSCTIASWEEKSLRHIAIIAKFIDLNKPRPPPIWQKKASKQTKNCHVQGMTFLCMMITFLPSFENSSGCLCLERLLRFRNFASMLMWCHTYTLYFMTQELQSSKFSCKLPS